MQISSFRQLRLHLRPLTLVLLIVVCGRFGTGQEAADEKGIGPSTLPPGNLAASGYELKIKPEDSTFTKAMGSSCVFTCEISGTEKEGNYDLKWFHNNTEITDKTTRMYVEEEGTIVRKLYVTGFEKQDEGIYKCTGMIDGTLWEKSITVFLFKDITFDHAPLSQHPAIYTDAVIECRISGRPMPELSWRHKGERLQTDKGGRYTKVEEGLRITNITLEDDGLYLCRAEVESEGRYGEEKINVSVHIPPKIVEVSGKTNAIEGSEISVVCQAEGLPDPEFQFYKIKDGETVAVGASERVQIDVMVGTLAFRPLKKEDEGRYLCRAHNDVGNDTKELDVEVLVKPAIVDFQNVTGNDGDTPTIFCTSRGDPAPAMTFRKAENTENYVDGENEDSRLIVSGPENGRLSLKFSSLIPSDSGDYVCRAESKIGSDEQSARLTVNYRPRFAKDHPQLVHIWAGKKRNMTCNVEGEPVPAIEWLRGNELITENSTFTIFNSERTSNLQVTVFEADQIWIYGNYTCKANNELGANDIKIELRRATTPDSPQSVNVTECLPNSIVIQVEPPTEDGGEKVKGYRVEYSEKMQNTSVTIGGEVGEQLAEYNEIPKSLDVEDADTITIENLKPNTSYMIRVKAKNDVGVSSPKELTVTTKSVQKPSPIQLMQSATVEAYSYTITWKKPSTGGLPIKDYEFKFRKVTTEDGAKGKQFGEWVIHLRSDDVSKPMLTYQLNDLAPSTTYELQVRAKNDLGWSDPVGEFQFQTREASASDIAPVQAAINLGTVVAIVVIIFVLLLIVVDVSCYFINHCGVTMCICVHLCGRSSAFTKEKAMEEGESKEVLKQPIETYQQPEEGAADGQTQLPPPAYNECKEQCLKSDDDKETQKEKEELQEALKEGIKSEKEKEMDAADDDVKVLSGTAEEKTEKAPVV